MKKTDFWIQTTKMAIYVYIIDQVIKWKSQGIDYEIIPGFFELIYRENTGIAFGLSVPVWGSILLTFILIVLGVILVNKNFRFSNKFNVILVGLVLGGVIGNLCDRLVHGFVIDYISIWKWPVFNFADACIVVGVAVILLKYEKLLK